MYNILLIIIIVLCAMCDVRIERAMYFVIHADNNICKYVNEMPKW